MRPFDRPNRMLKPLLLTIAMAAGPAAVPAFAQDAPRPGAIDLAAGSLAQALDRLGERSGILIMYTPELVQDLRAPAVRGATGVEEALRRLLSGSGLTWEKVNDSTFVLRRAPAPAAASGPAAAPAAATEPEVQELGSITVTATRREETLLSVSNNIQTISRATLERTGARRLGDFARTVAGLTFSDEGGRDGFRPFLRGLRSGEDIGLIATTAVYVDDVNVDRPTNFRPLDLKVLDVDQVEILRGPQGTLYGAGAIGGVIRYVTTKPDTYSYEGRASVLASATDGGGINKEVTGMLNLPLAEDRAALRVALGYYDTDGFIDNVRLGARDVNDERTLSGRFAFRLLPTDRTTVDLVYQREDSQHGERGWYEDALGRYNVGYYHPGRLDELAQLTSLTIAHDFGPAKLTSSTSYFDVARRQSQDLTHSERDSFYARIVGNALVLPEFSVYTDSGDDSRALSQEIRLVSDSDGPFDWLVGGYWYDAKSRDAGQLKVPVPFDRQAEMEAFLGVRLNDDNEFYSAGRERLRQLAFFGEVGFRITPAWRVSLGARHFDFSRNATRVMIDQWTPAGRTPDGYAVHTPDPGSISYGHYDETGQVYRFNTSYEFEGKGLAYFTVAEGFRPGGFNAQTTSSQVPDDRRQYRSDSLRNYEAGGRMMLGRDWYVNGAVYYIDWTGMQTQVQTPTLFGLRGNAAAAHARGAELEINGQNVLVRGLSVAATYTHTDVRLDERVDGIGLADERAPFVPRNSGSLMGDYAFAVGGDWRAGVNLLVSHTGGSWTDFGPIKPSVFGDNPNSQYLRLDGYWMANLSVRLQRGPLSMRLFVNNLTNTHAELYKYYQAAYSQYRDSFVRTTVARPRTVGFEIARSF